MLEGGMLSMKKLIRRNRKLIYYWILVSVFRTYQMMNLDRSTEAIIRTILGYAIVGFSLMLLLDFFMRKTKAKSVDEKLENIYEDNDDKNEE
jgi:hypothetical protein